MTASLRAVAPCFETVRAACLALLNSGAEFNHRTGQFLGGVAFQDVPLTEKQERWLSSLLEKGGLPPLGEGVR